MEALERPVAAIDTDDTCATTEADAAASWWPSRYGADDRVGTLNEISPAAIVAAARLVRQGKVFDLGRVLDSSVRISRAGSGNRRSFRMPT